MQGFDKQRLDVETGLSYNSGQLKNPWIEALKDNMKAVLPEKLRSGAFEFHNAGMRQVLFEIICDKVCLNIESKDVLRAFIELYPLLEKEA